MNQTSIDNDAPEIAVLSRELAAQQDRHLRFAADFDNFKRRTAREAAVNAAVLRIKRGRDGNKTLPAFYKPL